MEFCGQRYPLSRNRLPISRSSVDLDSRTILGIGIAKWTINGERDTIIHVQGHKVLAFGSFFEYELSWQGICLAIYCARLAERCVGRCPEFSEPNWHSSVIMFAWKSKKMALRACSASVVGKVWIVRLVFLLSSEDFGPWVPRDPVAVEPSLCPSNFQELAEPEPLDDSHSRHWRSADAWRGNGVCQKWTYSWLKVLENTPAILSLGKFWNQNGYYYEWILSNTTSHINWDSDTVQHGEISFLLWFQACQILLQGLIHQLQGHFQDRRVVVPHLLQARLHHLQEVVLRLENERIELKVISLQWLCQLRLKKGREDPMLTMTIWVMS